MDLSDLETIHASVGPTHTTAENQRSVVARIARGLHTDIQEGERKTLTIHSSDQPRIIRIGLTPAMGSPYALARPSTALRIVVSYGVDQSIEHTYSIEDLQGVAIGVPAGEVTVRAEYAARDLNAPPNWQPSPLTLVTTIAFGVLSQRTACAIAFGDQSIYYPPANALTVRIQVLEAELKIGPYDLSGGVQWNVYMTSQNPSGSSFPTVELCATVLKFFGGGRASLIWTIVE